MEGDTPSYFALENIADVARCAKRNQPHGKVNGRKTMEENVIIRHAVPGDEAMLAEIQAESWETAFTGILPDEKLKSHLDKQRIAQMYQRVLNEHLANTSVLMLGQKMHCMALWGAYRGRKPPGLGGADLHSQPKR